MNQNQMFAQQERDEEEKTNCVSGVGESDIVKCNEIGQLLGGEFNVEQFNTVIGKRNNLHRGSKTSKISKSSTEPKPQSKQMPIGDIYQEAKTGPIARQQ